MSTVIKILPQTFLTCSWLMLMVHWIGFEENVYKDTSPASLRNAARNCGNCWIIELYEAVLINTYNIMNPLKWMSIPV